MKPGIKILIVNEQDQVIGYKERHKIGDQDIYRVTAAWVMNERDEVLLAQRSHTKAHNPGKWGTSVSGTVEKGETYQSNIRKEILEELGISAVPKRGSKIYHEEGHRFFCQYFQLTVSSETLFQLQVEEVDAVQWYSRQRLFTELAADPDRFLPQFAAFAETIPFKHSMNTNHIATLKAEYPDGHFESVRHPLDAANFQAQKQKQLKGSGKGGVVCLVWVSEKEVVLVLRTGMHAGWAMPGGGVEADESYAEAAVREMKEETGLDCTVKRLLVVEDKLFISPEAEELSVPIVFFEAEALGQIPVQTDLATEEGLQVKAFAVDQLPAEMIMKDKEKILCYAQEKKTN